MSWDEMFPEGRVVFYEGDDPENFEQEMKSIGIDVNYSLENKWMNPCDWREMRSFYIPSGRVEEIYGSNNWTLGS